MRRLSKAGRQAATLWRMRLTQVGGTPAALRVFQAGTTRFSRVAYRASASAASCSWTTELEVMARMAQPWVSSQASAHQPSRMDSCSTPCRAAFWPEVPLAS
jgi:hypothetical protein